MPATATPTSVCPASLRAGPGRGLGADIVRVLCGYGFAVRGKRRLEANTLAGNHGLNTAAERSGFVREVLHRQSAWL